MKDQITNSGYKAVSGAVVTLVAASLLAPGIAAAGKRKGHNPNGKPFVELAGTIIEVEGELSSLQDQVDSLVGRVESVEEAQASIELAITDLEAENVELQAQIDANSADVASLEDQISALNGAILDLELQIAELGDADGSLQAQIDAHEASITTLALSIDTLDGDLRASIDNNSALIAVMQAEIASIQETQELYQLLVSGSCPAGHAIREIAADGSVICEVIDVTGSSAVTQVRAFQIEPTVNGYAQATATCPAGSILTGGGFWGNFGSSTVLAGRADVTNVIDQNVDTLRRYTAEVQGSQYDGHIVAQAICLEFN